MSEHREIPILMDAISVRGILDGTKMQTRRPVKPKPPPGSRWCSRAKLFVLAGSRLGVMRRSPFGAPGDLLWVRETFSPQQDEKACWNEGESCEVVYRADDGWIESEPDCRELLRDGRWYPSIHMPRWASRLSLLVTAVWLEELQNISEPDARAEGVLSMPVDTGAQSPDGRWYEEELYVPSFARRWDSIYASRGLGWGTNPWIWACEFEIAST